MASVLQLEQRNELTNLRAQQLTNFFKNGGFRTCVLKGQGVALLCFILILNEDVVGTLTCGGKVNVMIL